MWVQNTLFGSPLHQVCRISTTFVENSICGGARYRVGAPHSALPQLRWTRIPRIANSRPPPTKEPPSSHTGAALLTDHRGAHTTILITTTTAPCTSMEESFFSQATTTPTLKEKSSLDMTTPYPQAMSTTTELQLAPSPSNKGASQATSHCVIVATC